MDSYILFFTNTGVAMLVVLVNSQGAPESLILSLLLLALGITTFGMHANGTNKWWVVADGISMYIILLYLMSMNFTGGQYKKSIAIAMSIIPFYILLPWLNHIAVCVALITIWLISYFIAPGAFLNYCFGYQHHKNFIYLILYIYYLFMDSFSLFC